MKYRINYKIKSTVLEISDFDKLITIIENQAEQEQKTAIFRLDCKDKISYECNNKNEYISLLRDNLNNFESLSLSLLGENTTINFSYFNDQIRILIESIDRDIFLRVKEEVTKLFKNDSWNWTLPFVIIISILFILISPKIFQKFSKPVSNDIVFLTVLVLFGFLFTSKFYPSLVIIDGLKQTGRIFKNDLWKIIIIVITVIVIPVLLMKFF